MIIIHNTVPHYSNSRGGNSTILFGETHNTYDNNKIKQIYCFPGNAGTNLIAKNVNIDLSDFEKLKDFIIQNKIDNTK